MSLRVSAPGKAILMGEHAAVYGRPALVAAVDRRLVVTLSRRDDAVVRLRLEDLGIDRQLEAATLETTATEARGAWEAYARRPGPETFQALRSEDPSRLVQIALAETARHLERGGTVVPTGYEVRIESELPVGSGFGSSAALAVALAVGLAGFVDRRLEPDELHRLTLEIERRQHGMPSGVDNGAVIHGGVVWAERDAAGVLGLEPLELASSLLGEIRLYNSGEPVEPTGTVVAAVRQFRDRDPGAFEGRLDTMTEATRALRGLLTGRTAGAGEARRLIRLMATFEHQLEAIGVVPEPVRHAIRRLEARGAGAKISGAGALSGEGAGSLLVYHRQPEALADLLAGLEPLDTRLGAPGVRIES